MPDQTSIVAARAPDGVRITVYAKGGAVVVQTTLDWRRAMLLGLDLCNLATEPVFRAAAEKDPAGHGVRPVNPPAFRPPASSEV
jgi:hypothetical protein